MEFYFSLTVKPEKDVEAIDGIRIHTNLLLTAHLWTAGWASPAACQKRRIEAPPPPTPAPRPTESDPEFQQDAQVLSMYIHI